jgi:hypothetical protein
MAARDSTSIMEFWGLTENWIEGFFDKLDSYIQQYCDVPFCSANPDRAKMANDVLRGKKTVGPNLKIQVKFLYF